MIARPFATSAAIPNPHSPHNSLLTQVIAQDKSGRIGCTLYEIIQKGISIHLSDVQNQCEVTECTDDPVYVVNKEGFNQSKQLVNQ